MEMLGDLYTIALVTLRYGGLVTLAGGAIIWFSSGKSTQKNKKGIWLIISGIAMLIFYFGYSIFIALIKWVTDVDF